MGQKVNNQANDFDSNIYYEHNTLIMNVKSGWDSKGKGTLYLFFHLPSFLMPFFFYLKSSRIFQSKSNLLGWWGGSVSCHSSSCLDDFFYSEEWDTRLPSWMAEGPSPEPTWWREKTDSYTCLRYVYAHTPQTHSKYMQKRKKTAKQKGNIHFHEQTQECLLQPELDRLEGWRGCQNLSVNSSPVFNKTGKLSVHISLKSVFSLNSREVVSCRHAWCCGCGLIFPANCLAHSLLFLRTEKCK